MGCKCGSQIILCNLPVRFDTYRGCSHGCRYCFAQKKNDISHIERDESVDGLRSFIEGKRGNETEWCDWNIPIHWGGMSDPFQPVEKQIRASYECLKLLAETKYPFVVSTKGRLVADPEYHDLFHSPGFVYEKSATATWGGIRLHPHYEAKTMQWLRSSGIAPESTLFWITGAEPRSPGQS